MIYISHRMQDVFALSDRIMVLKTGWKVGVYKTAEVTMDEIVRLMILGRISDEGEA